MTIKEAIMEQVKKDHDILVSASSDLLTVQGLYALGESEHAIDLYGAIRTKLKFAFRSFPVLNNDHPDVKAESLRQAIGPQKEQNA